ncbi:MAG: DUF948 domain-containing protein [Chlorobi bacterium]|nr:DUF948 domain-containing protein [Chlorobiota bacterium]
MEIADLLYIAGAIALLALGGLSIYLITFFRETKGLIANASTTLNDLSDQLNTQLQSVDSIVKNVNKLTDDLTEVVDDVTDVIHEGRNVVVSLLEFEQRLQRTVQEPIIEVVSVFSALGKGIKAFRLKLAHKVEQSMTKNGLSHDHETTAELEA